MSEDPKRSEWSQLQALGQGMRPLPMDVVSSSDISGQQWAWLKQLLVRNHDTAFGRQHAFAAIDSVAAYQNTVPLTDYSGLLPYIESMKQGAADILFCGQPVAFEATGGTASVNTSNTGKKILPYSQESLQSFRRAMLPWLSQLIESHAITKGSLYWALSPALREDAVTDCGVSIGVSDAEYFGHDAGSLLAPLSAVPGKVGEITSFTDWQLVTLYYLLRRNDLALISVWSPTFLLALLEAIPVRANELMAAFAQGAVIAGVTVEADVPTLKRLEQYLVKKDTALLWPDLVVISCWMDAASQPFAKKLAHYFPVTAFQAKGLVATEGVITIPDSEDLPVLALHNGFYEFIDENGKLFLADQLTVGQRYEAVMTTEGGLYRYRIGDKIICESFNRHGIPVLRFIGRAGVVSDLVGEKLSDDFVAQCLQDIAVQGFVFPDTSATPRYILAMASIDGFSEDQESAKQITERLDAALSANPQYGYARQLGQLDGVALCEAPDVLDQYTHYQLSKGMRLGDIKIPSLRTETHWLETFKWKLQSL